MTDNTMKIERAGVAQHGSKFFVYASDEYGVEVEHKALLDERAAKQLASKVRARGIIDLSHWNYS